MWIGSDWSGADWQVWSGEVRQSAERFGKAGVVRWGAECCGKVAIGMAGVIGGEKI